MAIIIGEEIKANNLDTWYARLNTIRAKVGLSQINASFLENTLAQANHINDLNNALNNFQQTTQGNNFPKTQEYTVSVGELIRSSLANELTNLFDNWDTICWNHHSNTCTYGCDSCDCDSCDCDSCSGNCPSYSCPYSGNNSACNDDCPSYSCSSNCTQVSSDTGSYANFSM